MCPLSEGTYLDLNVNLYIEVVEQRYAVVYVFKFRKWVPVVLQYFLTCWGDGKNKVRSGDGTDENWCTISKVAAIERWLMGQKKTLGNQRR